MAEHTFLRVRQAYGTDALTSMVDAPDVNGYGYTESTAPPVTAPITTTMNDESISISALALTSDTDSATVALATATSQVASSASSLPPAQVTSSVSQTYIGSAISPSIRTATPSAASQRTGSINLAAPVAGTVVPITCITIFAVLFCWWYQKKKVRDRHLDDLERTAVWVTSVSETSSSPTRKIPEQVMADQTAVESNDICAQRQLGTANLPSSEPIAIASPLNTANDLSHDDHPRERDPFATPPSDDGNFIRTSQIGLAITTSIHSQASSQQSVSTVIRHDVRTWSDSDSENSDDATIEPKDGEEPEHRECSKGKETDELTSARLNMMRSSTDTVIYSPIRVNEQQ